MKFLAVGTLLLILAVTSVMIGMATDLEVNGGTIQIFHLKADIEIPPIKATIGFEPSVVEGRSPGNSVIAFIELPPGYPVDEILIDRLILYYDLNANGIVDEGERIPLDGAGASNTSLGDYDSDGVPDLIVSFNSDQINALPGNTVGLVVLTLSGQVGNREFIGKGMMALD